MSDKLVLEVGCFEGIHTVALAERAAGVKACDSRMQNIVKAAVRCAMFQATPQLFLWDVERPVPQGQDIACDILFHVGVLYHLADPVGHLDRVLPHVGEGLLLDTHYASKDMAGESYEARGKTFECHVYKEQGYADPFSGMNRISRWLLLEDLLHTLDVLGLKRTEVVERRDEKNGPRALILAQR